MVACIVEYLCSCVLVRLPKVLRAILVGMLTVPLVWGKPRGTLEIHDFCTNYQSDGTSFKETLLDGSFKLDYNSCFNLMLSKHSQRNE